MADTKRIFGKTSDGREVTAYTVTNGRVSAEILDFGATVRAIYVPDKNGKIEDVTVGYESFAPYETSGGYEGKTVGRFANRISGGSFYLDGMRVKVERNENGKTCLHGGGEFSFNLRNVEAYGDNFVRMSYTSPDGSFGFPGEVKAEVMFSITERNGLRIEYSAISSAETVLSFTNHSYFNLGGASCEDIHSHILKLDAEYFTPADASSIPTGEIKRVEGTPMDFREPKAIGRDIYEDYEPLVFARGYDHNFCLNESEAVREIAKVTEPKSGRGMAVYTDMPGVQLYTGGFLSGAVGKGGKTVDRRTGFCFETQFYPDTMNRPQFPSCEIKAGETYDKTTIFAFSVK